MKIMFLFSLQIEIKYYLNYLWFNYIQNLNFIYKYKIHDLVVYTVRN